MSILTPTAPGLVVRGDERAGAEFSACGNYRYRLWRDIRTPLDRVRERAFSEARKPRVVAWCMLNPSTADHDADDATIRRVTGFTRSWGYDGFVVVNLYAWRATDPRELLRGKPDTIAGEHNELAIDRVVRECEVVVCGWGANQVTEHRRVRALRIIGVKAHYLRATKTCDPAHPLYLPASLRPVRWT